MYLCNLIGAPRSLALALMQEDGLSCEYPGKEPILLSEQEYRTLCLALKGALRQGENYCTGRYQFLYPEDKDPVYHDHFILEGMYKDVSHSMKFDTGQGSTGHVVYVDSAYAGYLKIFTQMYAQLFGTVLSALK